MSNCIKEYYLGFMSYCSHDPASAIVELKRENGLVSFRFIHYLEGMLSRKKKSYHFPTRSISAGLKYFDIEISEINQVITDYMDNESFINTSYNFRHLVGDYIRNNLNIRPDQIAQNVEHHYAHAMAAWIGSGYEDCAFLAIDGLGSSQSTHTVFVTEDGQLKKVFSQTTPGIGSLYSLITELIGFEVGEEGKTMGLAPYGRELRLDKQYPHIDFKGVYNSLSVDYSKIINRSPNKYLLTDFGFKNYENSNIYNDFRAYLAYCVQQELEKCLMHLAKQINELTGKRQLCLSGGVALNCVANEIIAKSNIFDSVYVFPDSADSGLAVGLAFSAVHRNVSKLEWKSLLNSNSYPKFSPNNTLTSFDFQELDDLPWQPLDVDSVLREIQKDSVIGIFWEGFEYGPRALGHRSFIANATSLNMKEILNLKIKHREAYRPFAPICLPSDFSLFFESPHLNHEHMTYAVKAKKKAQELVPAIVHYDHTARVQIANEDCGVVYQILLRMKELYGFGILINTSFNDNDEPIVYDELDAVSCFLRTNCDVLIINQKMLFRNSIARKLKQYSHKITMALEDRNSKRFQESLKSILKLQTTPLQEFLIQYQHVVYYHKNFYVIERLHSLFVDIRCGRRSKIKRLMISNRELHDFQNLLRNFYYDENEIAHEILEIPDSADSIQLLQTGDYILSYNLSNILRDYNSLGILRIDNFEVFYHSSDFPLVRLSNSVVDADTVIANLSRTYENVNSLEIESLFK